MACKIFQVLLVFCIMSNTQLTPPAEQVWTSLPSLWAASHLTHAAAFTLQPPWLGTKFPTEVVLFVSCSLLPVYSSLLHGPASVAVTFWFCYFFRLRCSPSIRTELGTGWSPTAPPLHTDQSTGWTCNLEKWYGMETKAKSLKPDKAGRHCTGDTVAPTVRCYDLVVKLYFQQAYMIWIL